MIMIISTFLMHGLAQECPIDRLAVYVLDLPTKYNSDLLSNLERKVKDRGGDPRSHYSVFSLQIFEVYIHKWMLESSCRTKDPHAANLFYIPFYSYCAGRFENNTTALVTDLKHEVENYGGGTFWHRFCGADHVMAFNMHGNLKTYWTQFSAPMQILKDVFNILRIPSLKRIESLMYRTVLIPYYVNNPLIAQFDMKSAPRERSILLSFFGTSRGGSPKKNVVRRPLKELLIRCNDCEYVELRNRFSLAEMDTAAKTYIRSKFCVIPRGDVPNSKRLFDAIFAGCIPVVVSDDIQLPFTNVIDYSKFLLRFSEADVLANATIVLDALHAFTPVDIERYQENLLFAREKLEFPSMNESDSHPKGAFLNLLNSLQSRREMFSALEAPMHKTCINQFD